jgi:hypothetical protein
VGGVEVLYIGGEGRSGSTVLAALLGTWTGFVSVGEIRGVWRALDTDELCGCGEHFSACPFWTAVGERAFGGWDGVDHRALIQADTELARHRRLVRVLRGRRSRFGEEYGALTDALGRLYAAVADETGGATIVDSTKDPQYALILRGVAGLDLRLVHLVRDSRGVAFSWGKKNVERPEYADHPQLRGTPMNTRPVVRAALEWSAKNLLMESLGRSAPHVRVRYEDLFPDARRELARIVELAGTPELAAALPDPLTSFDAQPLHTVGGNRVRFRRGPTELARDEQWRTDMPARKRNEVTALTLPLLKAYGYPVGVG